MGERLALELAEPNGLPNEVDQPVAGNELAHWVLAVGHRGQRALGLVASCRLVERPVLGPPHGRDRRGELARDARLGEGMEPGTAAAAVEANGLHEADACLLNDVVRVAARQVEAEGVGLEQALVAAKQPLEGELVSTPSGCNEGSVLHAWTESGGPVTTTPVCIAT
jgi:hypothetical protein